MEMDVALVLTLLLWAGGPKPVTTQPSWMRQLWDQITGISDEETKPNRPLSRYGPELEDTDLLWGIPDTSAAVGHLFKYQIPHNAFSGKVDEFRVHEAGSPELPPWLYFNSSSRTFLGVASPLDIGATAVEVTTITKSRNHSVSTHFIIKVQADDPFGNLAGSSVFASELKYQADGSPVNMEQKFTGSCQFGQKIYRATLILETSMDKLNAKTRVTLLYKAARFLSQRIHSITVGPKKSDSIVRLLDTTTIIAGPGDSKKAGSNSGVDLSWIVGCDSFSGARDFAKVLEHNVLVGRFRQELGFQLIGWLITETLPPESQRKLSRQKRQAKARATPMPTPTLPTSVPTQIKDIPTASLLETTSLMSELSQTVFPSASQTRPVSSFLESSSASVRDVYSSMVEIRDSSQMYTTDSSQMYTTDSSQMYTTDSSQMYTTDSSQMYTTDSSQMYATDSPQMYATDSSQMYTTYSSQMHTADSSQMHTADSSQMHTADSSQMYTTDSSQMHTTDSSQTHTTDSSQMYTADFSTDISSLFTASESPAFTSSESLEGSLGSSSSFPPTATTSRPLLSSTVSTEPFTSVSQTVLPEQSTTVLTVMSTFTSTEELTVIETLLPSVSSSVSSELGSETTSGVLETIPLSPTMLLTSVFESHVSSTTLLVTEGSEFSSSPSILPTAVPSASHITSALSESDFVSSTLVEDIESTSLLQDSVTSNMFATDFEASSTESEVLPSATSSTLSDVVLESTSLTSHLSSSSTLGLSPSLSVQPSPTSSDSIVTDLLTTISDGVIPTLESSFSSSLSLSIEPTRVSTENTVSAMQTQELDTTIPTSSSVSDQTVVITPSVTSTSIIGSGTESVSLGVSRSVIGSESLTMSVSPALSSSMEASSSSTMVPSVTALITSTGIPIITEQQTPQLTVSTIETTVISSDLVVSILSTSSPVSSSPTSSVVNLVSVTPSPGQTLDFIPISHSSTEPTPTLSSTGTLTPEVPQTQTMIEAQPTTMTSSPEPSLTSIVILPSSSSEPVASASTEILLIPSSTLSSLSSELTSLQPPPTTSSEPPVLSTEFISSTSVPMVSSSVGIIPSVTSEIPVSSETYTSTVTSTAVTTTTPVTTSTTTSPNTRPQLIHPIDQINTKLGVYFEYRIPADTFYDPDEGNTRTLQLRLLTLTREGLAPDSWVQFDSQRQTIFGFPQTKDLPRTEADEEFVLVAEDTKGLQVQEALKILIDISSYGNLTHQFTVTLDEDYEAFVSQTINIINLISTISNFYGDNSPANMTVTNVSSGSVELHWSNTTLSRVVCENETIQQLYEQLSGGGKVNPDFRIATFPRYNILDVALRYQGACLPPPVVITPTPPVDPTVLGSTDSSIYYKTIIPAVIIALLLIIGVLICICLQRRKRLAGRLLLDDEKPIFAHDRHPVLLESDLEMRHIGHKSHRPLVLTQDGAYANPTFPVAAARRPPARPPPYRVPNDYGPFFDDDFDGASISPPPNYVSDPTGVYGRPPPAYRLPPPYSSRPGSSDA